MKKFVDRLKEDFVRWSGGEANNGNCDALHQEIKSYYDKHVKSVGDCFKCKTHEKLPPYYKDFLPYVAYFWVTRRSIYSVSIVRDIIRNNAIELSKDDLFMLEKLHRFLRTHPCASDCVNVSIDDDQTAKKIISHFTKSTLAKIDGMESLLDIFGEDDFIKAIIENSYFFNPRFVKSRFDEMAQSIVVGESIPARKSTQDNIYQIKGDNLFFVDTDFKCPIILDKDGNAEVRRVINATTGYTISQGKDSIFQNYCISHIWGRAYDPRYFSSLWNLAIIPAWGNSLIDKMLDEELNEVEWIAAKLKSIMETVCWKLYEMNKLNWEVMKMKAPQLSNSIKLDNQTFTVRILEGDKCIVRKNVSI